MGEDNEDRPNTDEQYASAVMSSHLRCVGDRKTPLDMIIAAGMNPERLGMALHRLETEWQSCSHPAPPTTASIEALASTYTVEPAFHDAARTLKNPHGGLVRVGEGQYATPLAAAAAEANRWHAHELGLLMQQLKTLPEVREGLIHRFKLRLLVRLKWRVPMPWPERDLDAIPHIVGAVLMYWLNPKCPTCHGVKFKVAEGTGRLTTKACKTCRATGERKEPHGIDGLKMLGYIRECWGSSRKALAGKFRHQQ